MRFPSSFALLHWMIAFKKCTILLSRVKEPSQNLLSWPARTRFPALRVSFDWFISVLSASSFDWFIGVLSASVFDWFIRVLSASVFDWLISLLSASYGICQTNDFGFTTPNQNKTRSNAYTRIIVHSSNAKCILKVLWISTNTRIPSDRWRQTFPDVLVIIFFANLWYSALRNCRTETLTQWLYPLK